MPSTAVICCSSRVKGLGVSPGAGVGPLPLAPAVDGPGAGAAGAGDGTEGVPGIMRRFCERWGSAKDMTEIKFLRGAI